MLPELQQLENLHQVMNMVIISYMMLGMDKGKCLSSLQQLQVSSHAINNALGTQNAQHGAAPASNLCPASILNNTRAKTQAHSLRLQCQQLIFALNLKRNLGLSHALPLAQNRGLGRMCNEIFVAGEGSVGGLGGNFSCKEFELALVALW